MSAITATCAHCHKTAFVPHTCSITKRQLCETCFMDKSDTSWFISKTNAKSIWKLNDTDLEKLKHFTTFSSKFKKNQQIFLFHRGQVVQAAYAKYGGKEGFAKHVERLNAIAEKRRLTKEEKEKDKKKKEEEEGDGDQGSGEDQNVKKRKESSSTSATKSTTTKKPKKKTVDIDFDKIEDHSRAPGDRSAATSTSTSSLRPVTLPTPTGTPHTSAFALPQPKNSKGQPGKPSSSTTTKPTTTFSKPSKKTFPVAKAPTTPRPLQRQYTHHVTHHDVALYDEIFQEEAAETALLHIPDSELTDLEAQEYFQNINDNIGSHIAGNETFRRRSLMLLKALRLERLRRFFDIFKHPLCLQFIYSPDTLDEVVDRQTAAKKAQGEKFPTHTKSYTRLIEECLEEFKIQPAEESGSNKKKKNSNNKKPQQNYLLDDDDEDIIEFIKNPEFTTTSTRANLPAPAPAPDPTPTPETLNKLLTYVVTQLRQEHFLHNHTNYDKLIKDALDSHAWKKVYHHFIYPNLIEKIQNEGKFMARFGSDKYPTELPVPGNQFYDRDNYPEQMRLFQLYRVELLPRYKHSCLEAWKVGYQAFVVGERKGLNGGRKLLICDCGKPFVDLKYEGLNENGEDSDAEVEEEIEEEEIDEEGENMEIEEQVEEEVLMAEVEEFAEESAELFVEKEKEISQSYEELREKIIANKNALAEMMAENLGMEEVEGNFDADAGNDATTGQDHDETLVQEPEEEEQGFQADEDDEMEPEREKMDFVVGSPAMVKVEVMDEM